MHIDMQIILFSIQNNTKNFLLRDSIKTNKIKINLDISTENSKLIESSPL